MTAEKELVHCCGIMLQLPPDLCRDFSLLLEVISPETWNNCLTDDNREKLMGLLPSFPENDLEEKTRTLEMFFMDVNVRYGTPLRQFHSQLAQGYFNPSVLQLRKRKQKLDNRLCRYREQEYLSSMLETTIVRRQQLLETVNSLPPPGILAPLSLPPPAAPPWRPPLRVRVRRRYLRELQAVKAEVGMAVDSSDDDEDSRFIVSKKQRRQLCGVESSLPATLLPIRHTHSSGSLAKDLELLITQQHNPLDLGDAHFQPIMDKYILSKRTRRKRGEESISSDTGGISLSDVIHRASQSSRRQLLAPQPSDAKLHNNKSSRGKKDKSLAQVSAPAFVKEEADVEDVAMECDEEQQQSLPSLARYITLASGEVKKEVHDDSEDLLHKTVKQAPASTAKRRLPQQGGRQKHAPIADDCATNGATDSNGLLPCVVKDEPADDDAAWLSDPDHRHGSTDSGDGVISVHGSFFCVLRDLICLQQPREQRVSRQQLERGVRGWQNSPAAARNSWHRLASNWLQLLPSAVNFLAGFGGSCQPVEYVPYLEYKAALLAYQWIGAGRDSDAKLDSLCHHWLNNRSLVNSSWQVTSNETASTASISSVGSISAVHDSESSGLAGDDDASGPDEPIPGPLCPTTWTVKPASNEEKHAFRLQEKLRYEKPHRAFTYKVHGYTCVVGPVKGIYSQHSGPNKARGHSLLTPHRPAYVTILALVRDAVARLPNGEGTRAEICELLRESQYLAPLHSATAESALNSVVSGALDRLHYEQDPCVKYLANKKIWVYLHRSRDEQEFERMHHLNGPGSTKNRKPPQRRHTRPKTPAKDLPKPPPNVAIDPHSNIVKVEGGGLVQVRPEDVLVRSSDDSRSAVNGSFGSKNNNAIASNISSVTNNAISASSNINRNTASVVNKVSSGGNISHNINTSTAISHSSPIARQILSTSARMSPQLTPTKALGAVKMSVASVNTSGNMRTLMASNLQTIQVSTTSGIHTIKVALPPGANPVQHFAKGTLVGRLSGIASQTLVGKKDSPQTIGQLIQTSSGMHQQTFGQLVQSSSGHQQAIGQLVQTSSGPQLIGVRPRVRQHHSATILSTTGGAQVRPLNAATLSVQTSASGSSSIGKSQQPLIMHTVGGSTISSNNTVGTVVINRNGNLVTRTVSSLGGATLVSAGNIIARSAQQNNGSATNVTGANNTSIGNSGLTAAVAVSNNGPTNRNTDAPLTMTRTAVASIIRGSNSTAASNTRPASVSTLSVNTNNATNIKNGGGNNITGIRTTTLPPGTRVQSISAHQLAGLKLVPHTLQQGMGQQSLLGQKLLVQGNKVLVQGGKVMQGGVQHLMAMQQPLSGATGGVQRLTLVSSVNASTTATVSATNTQRLVLGGHNTAQQTSGGTPMLSLGGKQVLLATKPVAASGSAASASGNQNLQQITSLGQVLLSGDKLGQVVANIGGQQLVLQTAPGGQQLMASALHGGQIALKGLQAFHTVKVIPGGAAMLGGGKQMLARVLQQQSRVATPSTSANTSGGTTCYTTTSNPPTTQES